MNTRKKLIYIIAAILLVIIASTGTVLTLRMVNNTGSSAKSTVTPTKASADALKKRALAALKANNKTQAKTLLEQAKQQYKDIGDTNNVTDTTAILFLINHQ